MFIVKLKTERANQMQARAGIRTQANDVAGVGRDFRLIQDHVEHRKHLVSAGKNG
jgi:hypothetical protein